MTLDSGTYSFFVILAENDKWTVIFNKVANQWGAFLYDENEDALRLDVSPRHTTFKSERLTYSISQLGFTYGRIILSWDFIELDILFETNYLSEFKQEIESRAAAQDDFIRWIPYLQGAGGKHINKKEECRPPQVWQGNWRSKM